MDDSVEILDGGRKEPPVTGAMLEGLLPEYNVPTNLGTRMTTYMSTSSINTSTVLRRKNAQIFQILKVSLVEVGVDDADP